jgi:hypothetical protein
MYLCRSTASDILVAMRMFALLALVALVYGCSKVEQVPVPPLTVTKGTKIPLLLAMQLNAGEVKEGQVVPLLVAEDVMVGGRVAIRRATIVEGEVTWSRSEGTLSGLINQPARLEVKLKNLRLASGTAPLVISIEEPEKPCAFTRENTGKPAVDELKVEGLLKEEANRKVAEKLAELFDGKSADLSSEDAKAALDKIAGEMGMNDTKQLLVGGQAHVNKITSTIERLQRGDFSGLTKGDLSLSLGAVMELANLVGGLGDRVSRTLKGRTIRAYPGTRIEAFIGSDLTIPPAS